MTDDRTNRPAPGPNKDAAAKASGVDRFLSRFGPVQDEADDRTAPGPRPAGGSVARPTAVAHPVSEHPAASSSGRSTATMEPEPLFERPADSVFDDQPAHVGTWTDPADPPAHVAVLTEASADTPPIEVLDRRDWVRMPRRTGPILRFCLLGFVALVVISTVYDRVDGWLSNQYDPEGEPGEVVEFEIASGATANEVTQQLFADGVIANPTLFRYWVADNLEGDFQAGQYDCLRENMSFEEARDCLVGEGPVPPTFFSITIPEGLRLSEIVGVLNDANPQFELATLEAELSATIVDVDIEGVPEFPIEGSPDPTGSGKEGLLFPATYQIDERDQANARAILARMADQMEIEFANAEAQVGRAPVVEALELTDYEILIVASLIEEEYGIEEDLGRISRVIYNRLEVGNFSLGIDATACYAASKPCADLTQEDLDSESPWNTRNTSNFGLPPTPIASPGAAAIRAALNPEPGDWLYYVLTEEDGGHTFAVTEGEFAAAVAICRERDLGC